MKPKPESSRPAQSLRMLSVAAALLVAAPLAFAAPNGAAPDTGAAAQQSMGATDRAPMNNETTGSNASKSNAPAAGASVNSAPKNATGRAPMMPARAAALQSAKVSLSQAIDTAEQMHGKAFYGRFELRHHKPFYLIRTAQNGQEWVGLIDADSGQLTSNGSMYPTAKLNSTHKRDMSAVQKAKTSLAQAVQTAEQENPGAKVLQASLVAPSNGKAHYDLQLIQDGHVRVAMINSQSGQLE